MESAHPWRVEGGLGLRRGEEEGDRDRERGGEGEGERNRREISHEQTCRGETVPCRRTPPFFLKRGLPDHNGGLEEREEEGMERGGRERENWSII